MKIAIHNGKDKLKSWNSQFMDICEKKGIDYIGVDCYSPDIIKTLKEQNVTHLMWAYSLAFAKDLLIGRTILNSAEQMGIKTFPSNNTSWHFEDKMSQKYLLESIDADVVNSWAFFDRDKASEFLNNTKYPLVAKLRRGAGSYNVKLIHNRSEGEKYVTKMFGKGIKPSPATFAFAVSKVKVTAQKMGFAAVIKKIRQKLATYQKDKMYASLFQREKGYVYFQEFLPNNKTDLRISIVGDKAWCFYRGVRPKDFRASASGIIVTDKEVKKETIEKSFKYTEMLRTQSLAFDYVEDQNGVDRIVEISYGWGFVTGGYWDRNLNYHSDTGIPAEDILNNFLSNNP